MSENQDDGLHVIREYTVISDAQQTILQKVVSDFCLVYSIRINVSIPHNATILNGPNESFVIYTSNQGFITTSKTPVTDSDTLNDDTTCLANLYLKSTLYSYDMLKDKWSLVILPNPYERYMFSKTQIRVFTAAFILHKPFPHNPDKHLWNSEV